MEANTKKAEAMTESISGGEGTEMTNGAVNHAAEPPKPAPATDSSPTMKAPEIGPTVDTDTPPTRELRNPEPENNYKPASELAPPVEQGEDPSPMHESRSDKSSLQER